MVEVNHSLPSTKNLSSTDWKIRIEGRLLTGYENEEEQLTLDAQSNKRFLNFFEKVKLEFPGNEELYPSVEWVKSKSSAGSSFDCLEIVR